MGYSYPKALYIIRLKVENVSIISSHLTWGFPAPTAFTGFAHHLERKLKACDIYRDIECCGIGILCHQFTPQVTKSSDYRYSPYQLNLARHPLESDGSTPAMVEEGKGHMEVSLIIGLSGNGLDEHLSANDEDLSVYTQHLIKKLNQLVHGMRLAGGIIFPHQWVKPKLVNWSQPSAQEKTKTLRRYLLPGFALMHRHDVLIAHQTWLSQHQSYLDTQKTAPNLLDTLLDISRLNFASTAKEDVVDGEIKGEWQIRARPKHLKGWLVPIPIGYAALTKLQEKGKISGLRDARYPATFAETLLSLGEWLSPHRMVDLTHALWTYNTKPEQGVYELIQPFTPKPDFSSSFDELNTQPIDFTTTDSEEEDF